MAERLTEHKTRKGITRVVVRPCVCEFQTVLNKLCAFEDIMEKYDIEDLEQLDIMLFCLSSETKFQLKQLQKLYKKYNIRNVEELAKRLADANTWQKACELACETLKQVMGKPLWIGGNIPAPEVKDTEYFYQQAKKEGNDE